MVRRLTVGALLVMFLGILPMRAWAHDDNDPAMLAKALSDASVTLERGLKASEDAGEPISGKYEIENGVLHLSIITSNGGYFGKVIVDHKTGAIRRSGKVMGDEELKRAEEQKAAMAQAETPLNQAVLKAVRANPGYRAVSVLPSLGTAGPVAGIILMNGTDVKVVTENLSRTSPYSTNRID